MYKNLMISEFLDEISANFDTQLKVVKTNKQINRVLKKIGLIQLTINYNLISYLGTTEGVSQKGTPFSVVRKSLVLGSANIRIAI